jgi:hypothetical protein
MAKNIRIPREGWTALAVIGKHANKLRLLKGIVEEVGLARSSLERVSAIFSERGGMPLSDAQRIVTQLLSFHGLRGSFGISGTKLYEMISNNVDNDAPEYWNKGGANIGNWKKARGAFIDALDPNHPFNVLQKRTRLTYEHQNVLYDVSMITDVRPTFDDSAREVLELSITHVLDIEYNNGSTRSSMYITLDSADVAKLKAACERAQIKEATLKTKLREFSGSIVIPGENDDD